MDEDNPSNNNAPGMFTAKITDPPTNDRNVLRVTTDNSIPRTHSRYILHDWDRDGLRLIDVQFLNSMFNVKVVNEIGKPISVTITEAPEHFANRPHE